jgi:hypothetical protein
MKNERKNEMKFSYQNLKSAEYSGDRVGNWKGFPVFASKKMSLDDKASGAFFIVYDDDNLIVKRDNGTWYCYGQVSESGSVTECDKRRYKVYAEPVVYCHDTQTYEPAAHAVCGKNAAECNGTAAAAYDEVVGDVKVGLDIDALLDSVRTMTVDSLLEGFNYGLDAKG